VRAKTFAEVSRYLTGGYFKPLHPLALDSITRKDIAARVVVIERESGSVTAARARSALSAFYAWAMRMGLAECNPVIGSVQPKDSESRERVLSNAELGAIWRASGDDAYGKIIRLLILTGARRTEIGGLRWTELDRDAGTWTLPAARAKNKHAHTLPLGESAWAIIDAVPRLASRDQLFGTRGDSFSDWSGSKRELDRRLGDSVAPFVLHDIRRTVATRMADIGIAPHIIETNPESPGPQGRRRRHLQSQHLRERSKNRAGDVGGSHPQPDRRRRSESY
jgi:integrase